MSELTTSQLVKLILGIFVFVAVVTGVYLIFKDKIINFFNNVPIGEPTKLIFGILK